MYLQCHTVYTAATLQHTQCTCSIGCSYNADTLHTAVYTVPTLYGSIFAVYTAATLKLYCLYTPLRSGQYGVKAVNQSCTMKLTILTINTSSLSRKHTELLLVVLILNVICSFVKNCGIVILYYMSQFSILPRNTSKLHPLVPYIHFIYGNVVCHTGNIGPYYSQPYNGTPCTYVCSSV